MDVIKNNSSDKTVTSLAVVRVHHLIFRLAQLVRANSF